MSSTLGIKWKFLMVYGRTWVIPGVSGHTIALWDIGWKTPTVGAETGLGLQPCFLL